MRTYKITFDLDEMTASIGSKFTTKLVYSHKFPTVARISWHAKHWSNSPMDFNFSPTITEWYENLEDKTGIHTFTLDDVDEFY